MCITCGARCPLCWKYCVPTSRNCRQLARRQEAKKETKSGIAVVELDYETDWQDAVELRHMGQKARVRVEFRSQENIAVQSLKPLVAGLYRAKLTFRQRNLFCHSI